MAYVEKHVRRYPSGKTAVRWRARYRDPTGKERSKAFVRKVDAERFATTIEHAKLHAEWVDPHLGKITLAEWAARWLDGKRRITPKTRATYENLLRVRILARLGGYPLARITRDDVEAWVAWLIDEQQSPSRIRQAHQCLSAMLEAACDAGYLGRNVARRVELPRQPPPEHRFLTPEEVAALAHASDDDQFAVLVYVLAYGGLRFSEAVALRRARCNLLRRRLLIAEGATEVNGHLVFGNTKNHLTRTVQLPPFVTTLLADHLETRPGQSDTLVFAAPLGGPLRYNNFRRKRWDPARDPARLPEVTPHDLRHTCASLMRAMGADLKAIQKQLGHRSAQITIDTYTHLFEDDLDDVMTRLDHAHHRATETPDRHRAVDS